MKAVLRARAAPHAPTLASSSTYVMVDGKEASPAKAFAPALESPTVTAMVDPPKSSNPLTQALGWIGQQASRLSRK
jgi:hypothetical protein